MEYLKASIKTITILLTVAFLSACGSYIPILSTDTELTLGRNERWSISYIVVLPSDVAPFLDQYQTTLNQVVAEIRLQGVEATWEPLGQAQNDPTISYKMNFRGTGYDQLNQVIFEGASVVTVDSSDTTRVQFQYAAQFSRFAQGQSNKFTLRSSEVFSSNGVAIDKGTVQWIDPPGEMTAVVSTALDLRWLWISLLGAGGMGFIVAGLGISGKLPKRQKRASSPAPVYSAALSLPQPSIKFCPQCGAQNPAEAVFCALCGIRIPGTY